MKSFSIRLSKGLILGAVGAALYSTASLATSPVPCLHLEKETLKEFGQRFDFIAAVEFKSRNRTYQPLFRKDGWKFLRNYRDLAGNVLNGYTVKVIEYYKWRGKNPPNDIRITVLSGGLFGRNLRGILFVGGHYMEGSLASEKVITKGAKDILRDSVVRVDACNIQDYDEKSAALAGQIEKF